MQPWTMLVFTTLVHSVWSNNDLSTCNARVSVDVTNDFTDQDLQLLLQILPHPVSSNHAVRVELRAPLHIACQMRSFPHLESFQKLQQLENIPPVELKSVHQPPHFLFYDANDYLVKTMPISSSWTAYQLRDLVLDELQINQDF